MMKLKDLLVKYKCKTSDELVKNKAFIERLKPAIGNSKVIGISFGNQCSVTIVTQDGVEKVNLYHDGVLHCLSSSRLIQDVLVLSHESQKVILHAYLDLKGSMESPNEHDYKSQAETIKEMEQEFPFLLKN